MVARGQPMVTYDKNNPHLKFWDYQTPIPGITGPNMPQTLNSLLLLTKSMVARGNQW